MHLANTTLLRSLLLCGLIVPAVLRAEAPVASTVEERLSKLEAELSDVRHENQALREQLGVVANQATAAATKSKYPEIRLNVLGSIEYAVPMHTGEPNTFELGDIDLVTTARVNEHASATSDYVIASNHGGFAYEIERLFVSYKFNDAFNLDVGRFHTAMGWYNNFYHNGTYFQTTHDRPLLFTFEDNMGLLPVHSTGLSLNGEIAAAGSAGLSYSLELSNGRRYTADEHEALQIEDDNSFKAVNFQLRAKPEAFQNWTFGVGAYHDLLTPVLDPVNAPDVPTHVDQLIFTGFAIFKSPAIEWFTETAFIGDKPTGGDRHWTFAGYTQLSHKFDKFRPYVRFEWREAATHDPVFELIGENESNWIGIVGVRYDFTNMMALKFELNHLKPRTSGSADEFSSQLSFRF